GPGATARIATWWANLTLFQQFLTATTPILLGAMLGIGLWITDHIQDGVVQSVGATSVLYTDSLIEAHVQDLAKSDTLSPESVASLDRVLSPQLMGKSISVFKLWKGDTIVYSSDKSLIGQSFPPAPMRMQAWSGVVKVKFFDGDGIEEDGQAFAFPV